MVGLFLVPNIIWAQIESGDFTISAQIVNDLVPPTTPTMLSVVPIAYDQIDVTWSASTDNFLLGGYVLLRDGNPVATTTLTTYLDTGLTASTTYSYEVYAFDVFYNLSTTSNSLSTTTPNPPPATPTPTSTSQTNTATRVLALQDLSIETEINTAVFSWQTNNRSRFVLRWGRNDAYDEGYIMNDAYRTSHQTLVGELEPGTIYLYELIGYGTNGIPITLKKGQFKTKDSISQSPSNVQNLQVIVQENDITLSWEKPIGFEGSTIRVVRSHLGYPSDPYDGAIVYEGKGNSFYDKSSLEVYGKQYYTVFVYADDGAVSSGAVVRAGRKYVATATSTPGDNEGNLEEELIEIPDFGFSVENILVKQGDSFFDFKSERIYLDNSKSFIISIPYSALPKHLKSIIVTLLDPTDMNRSYSFLLRINKDRTAYEATIAPIKLYGPSRLQIEIYDYEREIVGRYRKHIDFIASETELVEEVVFPDKIVGIFERIMSPLFWIFIIILLIIFLLYRRSKETEDNH